MTISYENLLETMQTYLSERYAAEWATGIDEAALKSYMTHRLREREYRVPGVSLEETVERLYRDMALYGFLTPYLSDEKLEEININSWDDIAFTDRQGRVTKSPEHFRSPGEASDMIKRLLRHSGGILDGAMPLAQGHLPGNIRVTAIRDPVVDPEVAVAASIRMLHPSTLPLTSLVESGMLRADMAVFLSTCLRCGVPFVVAGATGSGKTTLLNALLDTVPDDYRVFTIESGARELALRKKKDGAWVNNVVHTLSRPSEDPRLSISQEDLVVASLRFHPDVVCVGEMRDVECYAAVEASLTGHTVVSTVHSGSGSVAHTRIALLCQKRFTLPFEISLLQAAEAFPVVVFVHALGGHRRRVMDISECVIGKDGNREYRTLFAFDLSEKDGTFRSVLPLSETLAKRLLEHGASPELVRRFRKGGSS